MRTPFFGPAYSSLSTNLAADRSINLFGEVVEVQGVGKAIGALYTTPGLTLLKTVDSGPVAALLEANGTLFIVSNNNLWNMDSNLNMNFIGAVPGPGAYAFDAVARKFSPINLPFSITTFTTLTNHIWMVFNGTQVGVFIGIAAVEQDGFVLLGQLGSTTIWQSNLLDLTVFNPLAFAEATGNPDFIYDMTQIRREIFVHKKYHTEVWINAGTPNFAFQLLNGTYIEAGTTAQSSMTVGESLMWMFTNDQGASSVVQCVGFNPQRVSTHALEKDISSYPLQGTDAIAYTYLQNGHEFYVLTFPSGDTTWVYDSTTSAMLKTPMWHQRDAIDPINGSSHRHWANCHAYFNGLNVVGDYKSGNLYYYDLANGTDNNVKRHWLRSWRATPTPIEEPTRFNSLRIDMQTGVGVDVSPGVDPLVTLRWSDDGAHRFSNGMMRYTGDVGHTAKRVSFKRLGSTRRNSGLDRIFELSSGDALPTALIGAELM